MAELAKLMGAAWGELTAEEKQKYEEMAAKDKERYNKEKAEWKPPPDDQPGDGEEGKEADAVPKKIREKATGAKALRNQDFEDGPRQCK